MLKTFEEIRKAVALTSPVSLAVAGCEDANVLEALHRAFDANLIARAVITGNHDVIETLIRADIKPYVRIIDTATPQSSSQAAVQAVRSGHANVLMKGTVDSTSYLRAIVDKTDGIRRSSTLSSVTVAQMPTYPKLIAATDNGIIPSPDLGQKVQIIQNTTNLFRGLEIETVKVAALAATEKVSNKMPATLDAVELTLRSMNGDLDGFLVDGPFGYDVAVSSKAAAAKNLSGSRVAGDADLLLFANIEAANAVVKSWKFHGSAETGSLVLGASVPVLLNSRSDSAERRINGLLLALIQLRGAGSL